MTTIDKVLETMSPSKADAALECLFRWSIVYLEGRRKPPSAALAFGRAWDDLANVTTTVKMATGVDPAPELAAEVFDEHFSQAAADVETWHENDDREALAETGRKLARRWTEVILRRVAPLEIQGWVDVPIVDEWSGETWKVNGRRDYVAEWIEGPQAGEVVVIDNKTSARKWSLARVRRSTQAAVYILGAQADGIATSKIQFHVATKTKAADLQVLERVVDQAELDGLVRRFGQTRKLLRAAHDADAFLPNRNATTCSRRWCAFWEECEKKHGGRVAD
jgi:hypothetical protein